MKPSIIHLPDDKHEGLKAFAQTRGLSVNKLMGELPAISLAEYDSFTRFKVVSATGKVQTGLQLLDKLDTLTDPSDK